MHIRTFLSASLLLVAAWFLLAPIVVLMLMFRGLEKGASLEAVLKSKLLPAKPWASCNLRKLRRPPRS